MQTNGAEIPEFLQLSIRTESHDLKDLFIIFGTIPSKLTEEIMIHDNDLSVDNKNQYLYNFFKLSKFSKIFKNNSVITEKIF